MFNPERSGATKRQTDRRGGFCGHIWEWGSHQSSHESTLPISITRMEKAQNSSRLKTRHSVQPLTPFQHLEEDTEPTLPFFSRPIP